ncbi:MAG TPA: MBL fold metallo-hydrolase [Vicinamibacterales bacterium]|nr:MBL fold metallo-hydrolase [Vicinamibacterales bacterium]
MRNLVLTAAGVIAVSVSVLAQAPAQGQPQGQGRGGGQPVQPIQMVKPGLYVVPGGGSNSIVRVTPDGVILVDTKLPGAANYDALVAQIKTVTPQPVKLVIVTHHHADHTGNNDRFIAAGVQVLGHAALASALDTYQFDPKPAKPTATYDDNERVVRLGGAEVRVLHLGRAHTGGDSVVYFPDVKVVATSDAVTTGATGPLADYAGGGSFVGFATVLDAMLKLDFDTAIPGAGPVLTKADVQAFRTKIGTVIDRASAAVKAGVPANELLKQIKTDDLGWAPRIPMVDAFVAELRK